MRVAPAQLSRRATRSAPAAAPAAWSPRRWLGEDRWLGAVSVLSAVAVWGLLHALRLVPDYLLPSPAEVFATFVDILRNGYRDTSLLQNALSTLYRCGAGFVLACLTGIPLGLAMGYSPKIGAAFDYVDLRFDDHVYVGLAGKARARASSTPMGQAPPAGRAGAPAGARKRRREARGIRRQRA